MEKCNKKERALKKKENKKWNYNTQN